MNQQGNSKRFWSLGRKEENNKTRLYYILSAMSAEELGSGPRNFTLSPGVCFSSGGWLAPLMGHFLLPCHIPGCIKMSSFTYRWRHGHKNLSHSAYWGSAEEWIYCAEERSVWSTKTNLLDGFARAHIRWPACPHHGAYASLSWVEEKCYNN